MSYDEWKYGFYDEEPDESWMKDYVHKDDLPSIDDCCLCLEDIIEDIYLKNEINKDDLEASFNFLLQELKCHKYKSVPKERVRL